MSNGMVNPNVMFELDWLAKATKRQCADFRHFRFVSMSPAGQTDHAIIRFQVPAGACWIVTATTLRSFPAANAAFAASDFSSDENFDPVSEANLDTPYALAWWEVNGEPVTPQSAVWLGVFTTTCLFVFKAGQTVELKFTRFSNAVPTDTQLAAVLHTYIGPAEAEQFLQQMTTQIISHTDY